MLVTRIFSFSHYVFYPNKERKQHLSYIKFVCKCFRFGYWVQILSFGKGFSVKIFPSFNFLPHDSQHLTTIRRKPFVNIVGKRENARTLHFLCLPQCFLPYQRQHSSFQPHSFCHQQMLSIWTSLKFCWFGKELKG